MAKICTEVIWGCTQELNKMRGKKGRGPLRGEKVIGDREYWRQ